MQDCEVSILIPAKNGGALFRRCLSMVLSQRTSFVYEVIVIDSGSTDGTWEFMQSLPDPRLRTARIAPDLFNHGATRNQAAEMASGKLLVFLVQDAEPGSVSWLENLTARMSDTELAGVYARQLPRAEAGLFVKRSVEQGIAYGSSSRTVRLADSGQLEKLTPMERYRLCYFDNVCSCIRRSVWQETPFDAVDFGEDVRWSRKVLLSGKSLGYEPSAFVYHSHDRPLTYTFKRICSDHWNLYWIFGLETIPRFRDALRALCSSTRDHFEILRSAPVPAGQKIRLFFESFFRPLAEVSAQYWAVRMAKSGRQPRFRGI